MGSEVVKVTRNYQVTIPKNVRKAVGIEEGDVVRIWVKNGKIIVEKINTELPVVDLGSKMQTPTRKDIAEAVVDGLEAKE